MKTKRLLSIAMVVMFTMIAYAQKDVTMFLGIPVDGTKAEMKKKLVEKGFVAKKTLSGTDYFEGEFNGYDVRIYIVTNNNKVSRLMICDVNQINESDIKIRFNKLVRQFQNNSRYISTNEQIIPENEDISYEMTVHSKRYEAVFFQTPTDTAAIQREVVQMIRSKYTTEQLQNPTRETQQEIEDLIIQYTLDFYRKKSVWFMIAYDYGEYSITMFYDNEYNRANGEDL